MTAMLTTTTETVVRVSGKDITARVTTHTLPTATVVDISREDITARVATHTLPSAVPTATTAARIARRIGRIDCIYRCKAAATTAVTSVTARIPNVTHSIPYPSCVFEETSYYILCSRA